MRSFPSESAENVERAKEHASAMYEMSGFITAGLPFSVSVGKFFEAFKMLDPANLLLVLWRA